MGRPRAGVIRRGDSAQRRQLRFCCRFVALSAPARKVPRRRTPHLLDTLRDSPPVTLLHQGTPGMEVLATIEAGGHTIDFGVATTREERQAVLGAWSPYRAIQPPPCR